MSQISNKTAVIDNAVPHTTGSPSLARLAAEGYSIPTFQPSLEWEFLAPTFFKSRKAYKEESL